MNKQVYGSEIARPHMVGRNRVIADLLHEIVRVMENDGSLAKAVEAGDRYVVYLELDEKPSQRNPDWTESRLRMELTQVQTDVIRLPESEPAYRYQKPPTRWELFKRFIKGA